MALVDVSDLQPGNTFLMSGRRLTCRGVEPIPLPRRTSPVFEQVQVHTEERGSLSLFVGTSVRVVTTDGGLTPLQQAVLHCTPLFGEHTRERVALIESEPTEATTVDGALEDAGIVYFTSMGKGDEARTIVQLTVLGTELSRRFRESPL